MTEAANQYFQKRKIGIVISPKTSLEMQRIRSLYLLSGKKLGDIPTITDFVNGIITYFYFDLNLENKLLATSPWISSNGTIIPNLKKYFAKVEIERDLDEKEYEDFVSALPEDMFKSEIETTGEKSANIGGKQLTEINVDIPPNPTTGEPQQINMILTDEMVLWARKINKLINDILQNRILYSLSDLVKTIIEMVMSTRGKIGYAGEIYIAHLYNIEPKEFIKFKHGSPEVIINNPEYRNLIRVLTDKPMVDNFDEIRKKIYDATLTDNIHKMNKVFDEVDKKMDYDKLWSYVSDFNYKKALIQFGTFRLAVSRGLDISDITLSLYHGGLKSIFAKNRDLSKILVEERITSYDVFLMYLFDFMSEVYTYASSTNR